MRPVRAYVIRESSRRQPALEVAVSHALVEQADGGAPGPVLRLYRPAPTLALGRLGALRPGFAPAGAPGAEPGLRAGPASAGRARGRLPRGLPGHRRGAPGAGSHRRPP